MPDSNLNLLEDFETGAQDVPQLGKNGVAFTDKSFRPLIYNGDQVASTTVASLPIDPGVSKVLVKVTDAAETVRIGFGPSAVDAEANAAKSIPYAVGDGVQELGAIKGTTHIAFLGSALSVPFTLLQGN